MFYIVLSTCVNVWGKYTEITMNCSRSRLMTVSQFYYLLYWQKMDHSSAYKDYEDSIHFKGVKFLNIIGFALCFSMLTNQFIDTSTCFQCLVAINAFFCNIYCSINWLNTFSFVLTPPLQHCVFAWTEMSICICYTWPCTQYAFILKLCVNEDTRKLKKNIIFSWSFVFIFQCKYLWNHLNQKLFLIEFFFGKRVSCCCWDTRPQHLFILIKFSHNNVLDRHASLTEILDRINNVLSFFVAFNNCSDKIIKLISTGCL